MVDLSKCRSGDHNLEVIYSTDHDQYQNVVRWCSICGSVVVDVDFDGRTNPGQIMKLKTPEIAKFQ